MSIEKKSYYITVIFGCLSVFFEIVAYIKTDIIFITVGSILFVLSITMGVYQTIKARKVMMRQKLIQFLFFGSEYNKFNFLPKILLFADYTEYKNEVEIEEVKLQCNLYDNYADIIWEMRNIFNGTARSVSEYYFYTSNSMKQCETPYIDFRENMNEFDIKLDRVTEVNGVKLIKFGFIKNLKPEEKLEKMGMNVRVYDAFDLNDKEVIHCCPWNYGKQVNRIELDMIVHIADIVLDVELHKICESKGKIEDIILETGKKHIDNGTLHYNFKLGKGNMDFDMTSIYYILFSKRK